MSLTLFKKPALFTAEEQEKITGAIRVAEQRTSGEIRVFIESRCKFVDPLDRAAEIFYTLKMDQTAERNAVLIYLAVKDRQLALFADEGIHARTGKDFWKKAVQQMLAHFNRENYAAGTLTVISGIGETLHQHFPYIDGADKNELPDDIVFGK